MPFIRCIESAHCTGGGDIVDIVFGVLVVFVIWGFMNLVEVVLFWYSEKEIEIQCLVLRSGQWILLEDIFYTFHI